MQSVVPTLVALALTTANTEYSQELPANTYLVRVKIRDGTAGRLAFVTGKVATPTDPYWTIAANGEIILEIPDAKTTITLYLATGGASKVAEIMTWARSS